MRIFITGFMAVGKSSYGREIANELLCDFIDLDSYIEEKEGSSVEDIILNQGEEEFRLMERKALVQIIKVQKGDYILSLGGGTMCTTENADLLLRSGLCLYLQQSLEQLLENIPYLMKNRPLFKGLSIDEANQHLKQLYTQREAYYNKSQLVTPINTGFSTKKVANILKLLTNRPQSL